VLFHSATFLVTVSLLVVAFWLTPSHRLRLVWLFAASVVFYGWSHWPSVFLLLGSIGVNYALGLQLGRAPSKRLLSLGISLNLSLLLYFKYARFLADQVISLAASLGVTLAVPKPAAWAPLGISFFTFQMVAYLVDVHRKQLPAERDLLVFAVFKSFFAQLVAGPIVRGSEFLPQLKQKAPFDASQLHRGVWLVLFGLFLKVGVADVIGDFVDFAWKDPATLGINNAWLAVYAYAAQLLADFWGYSTMAVGLGLCFGLVLPVNFLNPYGASTLREFWRRWHITLSVWLRDYLYISLGGNPARSRRVVTGDSSTVDGRARGDRAEEPGVSKARAAFNRIVTMALGGLWHGPGWNFILWGVLHGVWMDVELATEKLRAKWPKALMWFITFHVVVFLWLPFRAPSMSSLATLVGRLFNAPWDINTPTQTAVLTFGFLLLQQPLFALVRDDRPSSLRRGLEWALIAVMLWLLLAYGNARQDFIYRVF
jgi:alginate O-acetyltransferase complex protein AlgI